MGHWHVSSSPSSAVCHPNEHEDVTLLNLSQPYIPYFISGANEDTDLIRLAGRLNNLCKLFETQLAISEI